MTQTHWKKLTNPDYLGSYSFDPGQDKILTIAGVKIETITGTEGKKENCMVMRFQEPEKPLILNRTNSKTVAKVLGSPYIEDWVGKRIQLYVKAGIKAFGEVVDAVRVREIPPREGIPTCTACGRSITGTNGRTALELAAATKDKYGHALCIQCARERSKK